METTQSYVYQISLLGKPVLHNFDKLYHWNLM